ncbi:MAG: glycogen synthase, partial [Firmicutes bacterium]|nr:glycogen synthase [Bacillota bacterium]
MVNEQKKERQQRRKLRVMLAFFEAAPFLKTGGLGDVGGSLPGALKRVGIEARAVLPKFKTIDEKYKAKMKFVTDLRVRLGWRDLYCGVWELKWDGTVYYFLDNEYYFLRDRAYGYFDDGERIAFFSKAVCEFLQYLPDFRCDVLHCNDWHTALSPVFLREFYRGIPLYDNIKTVFTIHNLKFQGMMSDFVLGDILGLYGIPAAANQLRATSDAINYMKGGLCYSDILTTVSPTYAEEIKSEYYGEHMEGIFRRRADILYGILNGIDTRDYDPATDKALPAHYTVDDLAGKAVCKADVQREFGLAVRPEVPMIAMISRLTEQKGLDLLDAVLEELLDQDIQLVVLGTGDPAYEDTLRRIASHRPNMAAAIYFSEALSRRLYAGADMLLMPSKFEPCGLSQMIAMHYGTLPIGR